MVFVSLISTAPVFSDSGISYGPYIQHVDAKRATILLKTDSAIIVTLQYKKSGSEKWKKIAETSNTTDHRFRLLGLEKNTEYEYYLSSILGDLTQKYFFTTNHDIVKNNPLNITAVGDFSLLNANQLQIVSQMQRIKPDILLGLGDCAYNSGTLQEFDDNFLSPYQPLIAEAPMYATMGNHDYLTENGGPYKTVFEFPVKSSATEDYYVENYDTAQIFSLNGNIDYSAGSAQYNWFQSALASSDKKWKIVMIHQPPYSSGSHGSTSNMEDSLIPLFDQYQVDLVLSGHDHGYERSQDSSGVTYIVSGGGGSPLYSLSNTNLFSQYYLATYNFVNIKIYSKKIITQAIDETGYIFDQYTIK